MYKVGVTRFLVKVPFGLHREQYQITFNNDMIKIYEICNVKFLLVLEIPCRQQFKPDIIHFKDDVFFLVTFDIINFRKFMKDLVKIECRAGKVT